MVEGMTCVGAARVAGAASAGVEPVGKKAAIAMRKGAASAANAKARRRGRGGRMGGSGVGIVVPLTDADSANAAHVFKLGDQAFYEMSFFDLFIVIIRDHCEFVINKLDFIRLQYALVVWKYF